MATAYKVVTSRGYHLIKDRPYDKNEDITLYKEPSPKPYFKIKREDLVLAATIFGTNAEWSDELLKKLGFPSGTDKLPDEWMNMSTKSATIFLMELYGVGGNLGVSTSGVSSRMGEEKPQKHKNRVYPDFYFKTESEEFARQLQTLWLRFAVKISVKKDKTGNRWVVRNSGSRAYVIARFAVLGKIDSPRIKDNIQRADATVPLHARIFSTPCIRERVVSCEEIEVEDLEQ